MGNIRSVREFQVHEAAMTGAMEIFEVTKAFPEEERYSMGDQMRRSSRPVCANLGEAWRRRRSGAHFRSKLGEMGRGKAEETRVWIEGAHRRGYLDAETAGGLDGRYDQILGKLVRTISGAEDWTIRN